MVLYDNAKIEIAIPTTVKNAEGTKIKTYDFTNPIETIRADVQPNTLTQYQVEMYGINEKNANTKKVFYEKANYIISGNRAKVTMDNGKVGYFSIMPLNEWNDHCECLLVPVENEC